VNPDQVNLWNGRTGQIIAAIITAAWARDMGDGASVYMLSAKPSLLPRRLPLVGTFEPAPKESVSSVAELDAYTNDGSHHGGDEHLSSTTPSD